MAKLYWYNPSNCFGGTNLTFLTRKQGFMGLPIADLIKDKQSYKPNGVSLKANGIVLFLILSFSPLGAFSQVTLEANGSGNTYELINSILAPGHDVIEAPDCSHKSFGRHIDEIFDVDLNKFVFRFFIHKSSDNDRCKNFDRQRNEIKSYNKSPDNLLGIRSERVEYKWKFKLDNTFQPSSSFTHLHQIKAVGGSEASMPLITITARKGNPDKLQLRYAESRTQVTLHETDLDTIKGSWVEVTETILYGESGSGEYEIVITKLSNNDELFYYSNNAIRTWKTNAIFLRPKWGIYRSLNDSINLKDEEVLFADFSIHELNTNIDTDQVFVDDFELVP